MAKEINEKTFESNITNELLNLSKSFVWYLDHSHWLNFPPMRNRNIISHFMNQVTLFAEGLTQKEESKSLTGGYDVSINYNHPSGQLGRLMFLQYKAGIRKSYSNKNPLCGLRGKRMLDVVNGFSFAKINPLEHCYS